MARVEPCAELVKSGGEVDDESGDHKVRVLKERAAVRAAGWQHLVSLSAKPLLNALRATDLGAARAQKCVVWIVRETDHARKQVLTSLKRLADARA